VRFKAKDSMRNLRGSECQFHTLRVQNVRLAKRLRGGQLPADALDKLRTLTTDLGLSLARGEIQYLETGWYVTHGGLLHLARRDRCAGIQVRAVREFCDPASGRWVFRATVYKVPGSKGFVGYGDADPSNVSSLVHGAEMRVAETRAVNRALRKAYGIGLCSVEELGWSPRPVGSERSNQATPSANGNNGHHNGQPRLRDQLCLLIRKHKLDAGLVKAYAADYCGTPALRDASRTQIESFVTHFADWAARDRDSLLCKLNSYSPMKEEVRV
jgi:hypothetical protein